MMNVINKKRNLLKFLAVGAVVGSIDVWKKPVLTAVVLPAHAQTSESSEVLLSCSMTTESLDSISEGATTNQNIVLTFSTTPATPGADINWVGRCNGVDDFAIQTNTLDANGELQITVQTSLLCGGGPPNNGDVILHNGELVDGGSSSSCSIVYGP